MKLIIENFRNFINEDQELPADEMTTLLFQALQGLGITDLNENDKFFKGLLAGGLMAVAPLVYGIYAQDAEDSGRYRIAAAQAAKKLGSTATKIAELDKQLNTNAQAWTWSDDTVENPSTGEKHKDPNSTEMLPTVNIEGSDMVVMSPSWSVSMQVLQDKQAGTINVPGFAEGQVPPLELIIKTIDNDSFTPTDTDTETVEFMKKFKGYLLNTSDIGGTIQGIDGVVCNGKIGCNPVAVNPAALYELPNYQLPDSGMTAQETYIKVFFGQYFGAEEALKYGEVK
jgi:hypothetical protein